MSTPASGNAASSPEETGVQEATPALAEAVEKTPLTTTQRLYSGKSSADRILERFERLIEAGVDVFGTQGYATASVKALCQRAGLSERYFYESFGSREDLLTTVYDHLATAMMQSVKVAVQAEGSDARAVARAANSAVVNFMLGDPRHARIILVEIVGVSTQLEAKRHQSLNSFAQEAMRQLLLLSGINPQTAQEQLAGNPENQALSAVLDFAWLTAVSVVGAVNNMLRDALQRGKVHNTEGIVYVACQLMNNAALSIRALSEH